MVSLIKYMSQKVLYLAVYYRCEERLFILIVARLSSFQLDTNDILFLVYRVFWKVWAETQMTTQPTLTSTKNNSRILTRQLESVVFDCRKAYIQLMIKLTFFIAMDLQNLDNKIR